MNTTFSIFIYLLSWNNHLIFLFKFNIPIESRLSLSLTRSLLCLFPWIIHLQGVNFIHFKVAFCFFPLDIKIDNLLNNHDMLIGVGYILNEMVQNEPSIILLPFKHSSTIILSMWHNLNGLVIIHLKTSTTSLTPLSNNLLCICRPDNETEEGKY